ncbi:PREDICTED: tomoregulin-2 [Haliaeetus leucocephalus]|nr:PREDICTED: tomoregulin-2 [Haliaeetus leucocephalus]
MVHFSSGSVAGMVLQHDKPLAAACRGRARFPSLSLLPAFPAVLVSPPRHLGGRVPAPDPTPATVFYVPNAASARDEIPAPGCAASNFSSARACPRYDDRENDLFLCDTNTCKFDGECLRIGDSVTCVCQFKCNNDYVPVCGSNGDTYQNECYLKQAACKQQSEILLVSEGSCATDAGSGSGDGVNEGSGETNQKETSTCDICQFGAECDEDAEDVWCVCNIDCSQTNFNPLCASDGKSYDNACQIKEASCQKQEKIEVMSLGRCQDNTTTTTKSEDGHYARTDYAENANKLEESARGIYIPCPEHYNGFCMHGKCEHSTNMLEPSCRCDAGYTGQHCEKKDYSVLYVVPGPVRFQYVLIAAVIGTIQIAIICVVVLCITRKCPRSNRIHRQKQNTGHYSSDNTTRASTSSSGNFESTELSSRVLSWSKISDNYGCGKGEE